MNVFAKSVCMVIGFGVSLYSNAMDVYLDANQSVHQLAIETSEDVTIHKSGPVWLEGYIKTDGRITFTGAGDLHLNPTLIIDGYLTEMPEYLAVFGAGNIHFNTEFETKNGAQTWPIFGSKLFINADISSGGHLSLTGPFGGTYINSGVTVETTTTFYSDNYSAEFIMSPDSILIAGQAVGVLAESGIKIEGEIQSRGSIQLNSRGPNSYVEIKRPVVALGENAFSGSYVAGEKIFVHAPTFLSGTAYVNAGEFYNYGSTLQVSGRLIFDADELYGFGGFFLTDYYCINGEFYNFGMTIYGEELCDR